MDRKAVDKFMKKNICEDILQNSTKFTCSYAYGQQ